MFRHIVPVGEEGKHIPVQGCPCKPHVVYKDGAEYLFHPSFDKREVWLAVEKFLGITCYEHGLFVNDTYERGIPHLHEPAPEPVFEYDHKKIDPR